MYHHRKNRIVVNPGYSGEKMHRLNLPHVSPTTGRNLQYGTDPVSPTPPPGAHYFDLGFQSCEPCVSASTGANWCVYPSVHTWSGEDKDLIDVSQCRDYFSQNLSAVRRRPATQAMQAAMNQRVRPVPHSQQMLYKKLGSLASKSAMYGADDPNDPDDPNKKKDGVGVCDSQCHYDQATGWGECDADGSCAFVEIPGTGVCTASPVSGGCCDDSTTFSTEGACEAAANGDDTTQGFHYLPECQPGDASLGCCWTADQSCGGGDPFFDE